MPPALISPLPEPIVPPSIPMAKAWGDVPIHSIHTDVSGARNLILTGAATPDGRWLVGALMPDAFEVEGKVTWGPGEAVLVRVADGAIHPMARLTLPQSQMGFASADDRWVLWEEEELGPDAWGGRVRLHDRQTGVTRNLTREVTEAGGRLRGASLAGDGHLLFEVEPASSPRNAQPVDSSVRVKDLRTGKVTILAEHAADPVGDWPWVAWVSTDREEGDPRQYTVRNVETGQEVHIDVDNGKPVLHHGSLVFSTMSDGIVCTIDDLTADTPARPILADPDNQFQWISMNRRAIGLTQSVRGETLGSGLTQVYDRQLQAMVDLPMIAGFSDTSALGPLIVWSTPRKHWDDPNRIIRVVDTRDIKK
ncbi:MAG: hypothetical protein U0869_19035 [Chloroflexota bacterium]